MSDIPFQALFILTVVTFIVLWGHNLISVGVTRDKFYTPTEGIMMAAPRFILLGASLVGTLVYSVNPRLMSWSALPLPFWLRWLGFLLGMAALGLFFWVIRSLGRNFSTTLTINRNQALVTQGPYQWVRHPMYTSFVMLWTSFFLMSGNGFIGLTGISALVLAIVVRTPKEEQMMIDRFGEQYIDYMKGTGRYLPRRLENRATAQDGGSRSPDFE